LAEEPPLAGRPRHPARGAGSVIAELLAGAACVALGAVAIRIAGGRQ
jgi:hypothetical protein